MIYVCGDSFAVSDSAYGPCWTDLLANRCPLTNLAQVAATNLLIARQVDQALAEQPSFIILLCTAVTRAEKRINDTYVPFSYHTASSETTPFSQRQLAILKDYYTEFFDLDLAIYQNQITIEHTLHKLTNSGIPFLFDQGGFENPSYGNVTKQYFEQYKNYRSEINLWNFERTAKYRPYFHIVNSEIHKAVADYYAAQILKHL